MIMVIISLPLKHKSSTFTDSVVLNLFSKSNRKIWYKCFQTKLKVANFKAKVLLSYEWASATIFVVMRGPTQNDTHPELLLFYFYFYTEFLFLHVVRALMV